jgi:hypothetical protein
MFYIIHYGCFPDRSQSKNSEAQNSLGRVAPDEQTQGPSSSFEDKANPLKSRGGPSISLPHSSKDESQSIPDTQHLRKQNLPSTEEELHFAAQEQLSPIRKWGSAMLQSKYEVSESQTKRRRTTPSTDGVPEAKMSAESKRSFSLKKLIDCDSLKKVLIGFVIICDVTKDSTLNNDVLVVEDSFKRSRFGPCTWQCTWSINNFGDL